MQKYSISLSDSDQTLIKYLTRILPAAPQGLLFKQLRKKNIILNGQKASGREKLKSGDEISVFFSDDTIAKFSLAGDSVTKEPTSKGTSAYFKALDRFGQPNIKYEDENVLVFFKPEGILSQKAKPEDLSANEWIIGYLLKSGKLDPDSLDKFTPSVCNRLDRNTAGLMLFGKTVFGTNLLNRIIKDKSLQKYYITVVHGNFDLKGTFSSYLYKDERTNKVTIFDEPVSGASLISADFKALKYNKENNLSKVEVLLHTGKSHQIRAELMHLNFPVYGDLKYSGGEDRNTGRKGHLLVAYKLIFPELPDYPSLSGLKIEIDTTSFTEKLV